MVSTSVSSPRKFGSIAGAASGSALCSQTLPRLFGRSRQTWHEKPVPQRGLRPWSFTIAMQKCSWISGTSRSGRGLRKTPPSATCVVIQPRSVAGAGQHQGLGGLERAGGKDHFGARADLPGFLALPVFDADRALALEQDTRRLRMGLGAQIRARAQMGMDIAARGAPALAVLLCDLVAAEALLLLGVEIVTDAKLRLACGLQIDFPHRIVGAQSTDMERAALAVIGAVEFGIILRAFEIGQHVGIGPAGVAERGPVVVIAAVAADIDHGIDRRRTAEPLAARLIADAPLKAGLWHGIEGPVVDLAGDHQDHRARRGHDPIVAGAAGFHDRDRNIGVLRETACDRAASGTAANHYEIECVRHA